MVQEVAWWETRKCLAYIVDIMAADALVTQGACALKAIILA